MVVLSTTLFLKAQDAEDSNKRVKVDHQTHIQEIPARMESMPTEIVHKICGYLPQAAIAALGVTCKELRQKTQHAFHTFDFVRTHEQEIGAAGINEVIDRHASPTLKRLMLGRAYNQVAFRKCPHLLTLTINTQVPNLPTDQLPEEISLLEKLQKLSLRGINAVAETMGRLAPLTKLRKLNINVDDGFVVALPPATLENLQKLVLYNEADDHVNLEDWGGLAAFKNLTKFEFSVDHATELPAALGALTKLRSLTINDYRGTDYSILRNLQEITDLILWDSVTVRVPDDLIHLPKLQYLEISDGFTVGDADEEIGLDTTALGLLPHLTDLTLDECIDHLPQELTALQELKRLSITGNQFPVETNWALLNELAALEWVRLQAPERPAAIEQRIEVVVDVPAYQDQDDQDVEIE